MGFYAVLDQVVELLRQRGRVTYRALKLQFNLDDNSLETLKEELIDAQRLAVEEQGTEATEHLLRAVEAGKLLWVASDALLYEIRKCPEESRRTAVLALCARAAERVASDEAAMQRRGVGDN